MKKLLNRLIDILGFIVAILILVGIGWSLERQASPTTETSQQALAGKETPLAEVLRTIPKKYGVPEELARCIVQRESGGRKNAIRFEPQLVAQMQRKVKDPELAKLAAASHGYFQVLGIHALERGLEWSELYDAETNAELAMVVLSNCYSRFSGRPKLARWYSAVRCYNGAGPMAEKYAQEVMAQFTEQMMDKILTEEGRS